MAALSTARGVEKITCVGSLFSLDPASLWLDPDGIIGLRQGETDGVLRGRLRLFNSPVNSLCGELEGL